MRPLTPGIIAAWVFIGLLAFGPPLDLPAIPWLPIGAKPPFPADKLSVLIVEESEDRPKLTSGQLDAMLSTAPGSVRDYITKHGGDFRLVDKDNDVSMDVPWVQAAFKVPHSSTPWIVAANSRTGFSEALSDSASALAKLSPMGGK